MNTIRDLLALSREQATGGLMDSARATTGNYLLWSEAQSCIDHVRGVEIATVVLHQHDYLLPSASIELMQVARELLVSVRTTVAMCQAGFNICAGVSLVVDNIGAEIDRRGAAA